MNTAQGPNVSDSTESESLAAHEELREEIGDRGDGDGDGEEEDLYSSGGITYEFDAGWELRPDAVAPNRAITRWFVMYAATTIDQKSVAGIAAGYQGGGSFTMQRFYAEFDCKHWEWTPGSTTSLRFEDRMEDSITGEVYELEDRLASKNQNALHIMVNADAVFWRWHEGDVDEGFQGDSLLLRPELWDHEECERDEDMIRMRSDFDPWVREVCEHLGLTAAPVFDLEDDEDQSTA